MKTLLTESLREFSGPLRIVDIGAMPSTDPPRYLPLVDRGLAIVCAFDCDPGLAIAMNGARGQRPVVACIADGSIRTFYRTRFPGCSSLYEPDAAMIDLFHGMHATLPGGNFRVVSREQVKTVRLDDILAESPDLITVDVQGAELDVLRGGVRAAESTMLIDWARALFVRDLRNLSGLTDGQLTNGAGLLHDVYLSYDLAYRYLAEVDNRNSGALRDLIAAQLPEGPAQRLFANESCVIDEMATTFIGPPAEPQQDQQ